MRRWVSLVFGTLALTLATGIQAAPGASREVPTGAIALVGSEQIPRAAFDQLMRRMRRSYELNKRAFPKAGTAKYRAVRDAAVALLVWRVTLRQAAAEFGVEIPEAVVEARLGQIREQWGGNASFQRLLRRIGLTENLLRDDIRTRMLLEAVRDKIWASVTVSDEEIADHYRRNLSAYVVPENRDVRHVLVRTRADAERVLARLRRGVRFQAVARSHSLDKATRNRGGLVAVYRGRGDPRFERAAFALRVNAVSRPVRSRLGWHVIQALSAIRPARTLALQDVRTAIRDQIKLAKANSLADAWVRRVKAEWAAKTEYAPGFEPAAR